MEEGLRFGVIGCGDMATAGPLSQYGRNFRGAHRGLLRY